MMRVRTPAEEARRQALLRQDPRTLSTMDKVALGVFVGGLVGWLYFAADSVRAAVRP